MKKRMSTNDSGTNIILEYIISLIILSILFTMFLLYLNDTIRTTNNVTLDSQLGIVANDVANRIMIFSNDVSFNRHNGDSYGDYFDANISNYEANLNLPDLVQNQQYIIKVTWDPVTKTGHVNATYVSDYSVNSTATFYSNIRVESPEIYSRTSKGKISYDHINDKIMLSG